LRRGRRHGRCINRRVEHSATATGHVWLRNENAPEFEVEIDKLGDADTDAAGERVLVAACVALAKADSCWLGVAAWDGLCDGVAVVLGVGSTKVKRFTIEPVSRADVAYARAEQDP